ncbi:MAG: outer membrane lipoprotein carrier protein LolA [Desulfobacterales bacterium]|nr:outer membrane lipoprotein carrier protein LolA [Desulfobacterales bacterium]
MQKILSDDCGVIKRQNANVLNKNLLLTLFVLFLPTVSIGSELDDGLAEIIAAQSEITSLKTSFVQTKNLSLFDETIEASGTVVIEKPDFYCWTYEKPERSVFYVDGMRTGSYEPKSGERKEVALDNKIGLATIIQSLTSIITGNLESTSNSDFDISQNPTSDKLLSYTFRPHAETLQSLFKQVTIRFDQQTKLARDLEILEQNGDTSQMQFDDWRTNVPVDRAGLLK